MPGRDSGRRRIRGKLRELVTLLRDLSALRRDLADILRSLKRRSEISREIDRLKSLRDADCVSALRGQASREIQELEEQALEKEQEAERRAVLA